MTHIYICRSREQIFTWKHWPRVKFWQDFGVVGTPATDSAGSIRVYAHSTETRSSAPIAAMLRQSGQREGHILALSRSYLRSSYTWGTRVVPFALTFHLYAWNSIVSLVLTLQLFLGYWRFLACNHAVVMLRIIVFISLASCTRKNFVEELPNNF